MNIFEVDKKPAVRIKAVVLKETIHSYLCDCEGDAVWFAKCCVTVEDKTKTILVQEWLYDLKVKNGEL